MLLDIVPDFHGTLWTNFIRREDLVKCGLHARSSPQASEGIHLDDLIKHYSNKFSASLSATPIIDEAERDICNKFNQLKDSSVFSDFVLSEHRIKNCIKRLKNRPSPGLDGISAEHLKFCIGFQSTSTP